MHVLLEVSPHAWELESFELKQQDLPSGIVPAESILANFFPSGVQAYWHGLASFNLVVHHSQQSLRPSAWRVSHAAAAFIRRVNPHVIHFDEGSRRMLLNLIELGTAPMVLTIHDPENHSGERHWRSELDRYFFLKRASRVLLYNRALQPEFARHYSLRGGHVRTTQLGVHHVFREWAVGPIPRGGRTVLFYGRLSQYKGLEVLYAAAPLVAQRVPNVRFVVAGRAAPNYRPPSPPRLTNGGSIDVIDQYIGNTHLANLLAGAHVVVCPYLDATQSGVVLTAFAFEKPVVATRVGGLPEYIDEGQTGLLVPPYDAEALAAALERILTDDELGDTLRSGIAGLARAGRLTWAAAARDTQAIYEELALGRR
ncbi:MAG TPA: glycosyltransferase family 4 protein [Chloroflexota bacterium]|nr:glycosyltransferase family 4 protein [Chloroflexota bacterium]